MPTTSLLDVRFGRQEPVVHHLPPGVVSLAAAEEAIELADAYGVCDGFPLAESQKITLRGALGERADGKWAATRVGDFGPRQGAGKNDKIAARELAGLILFGEQLLIHTAHEFPTANEAFLRLVAVFDNYDDLRKKVKHIYYANGAQSIELLTGQRLLYKARTGGAGRGFAKADLVVYDEAQHLARGHVAASGPAKLANPNSQSWYAGSGGLATSAMAWEIRRAAILGTGGRLAYTEATAEVISVVAGQIQTQVPDPSDLDAWYRAMPGLGRWVTEEGMQALAEELGSEFPREGLCVWDPEPSAGGSVIPLDPWHDTESADPSEKPPSVFAVDVAPLQASASIAGGGFLGDRPLAVLLENHPGTGWLIPALVALKAEHLGARFVASPDGPAGSIFEDAKRAGIEIEAISTRDYAAACSSLLAKVLEGRMRHRPDTVLDAALAGAIKRDMGDGAWLWSRKSSLVDISSLVAFTLALASVGETVSVYESRGVVTL